MHTHHATHYYSWIVVSWTRLVFSLDKANKKCTSCDYVLGKIVNVLPSSRKLFKLSYSTWHATRRLARKLENSSKLKDFKRN